MNDSSSMPGGNNLSGMESLSGEYFGALYLACPLVLEPSTQHVPWKKCPLEEIDQLLSLPNLHSSSSSNSSSSNSNSNESSISTEQAIQYLNAVVSLSPTFQLATGTGTGTGTSSSAWQQSSTTTTTTNTNMTKRFYYT